VNRSTQDLNQPIFIGVHYSFHRRFSSADLIDQLTKAGCPFGCETAVSVQHLVGFKKNCTESEDPVQFTTNNLIQAAGMPPSIPGDTGRLPDKTYFFLGGLA
jgi:hypothetical protein